MWYWEQWEIINMWHWQYLETRRHGRKVKRLRGKKYTIKRVPWWHRYGIGDAIII
jgi:hypothetical protein